MTTPRMVRQRIWERLQKVARPDTRFHLDFAEFIPDFDGSDRAAAAVAELPEVASAALLFVTPDNSLVELRRLLLERGRRFIVPTYNLARGFVLMDPARVPRGHERFAAWLDGIAHFGQPVTLEEIVGLGRFDALATGASAVSVEGIRFGRGHGYFDLEWGMFSDLGLVGESTRVICVVHDVQVVDDKMPVGETEIVVDLIATPTRTIKVSRQARRPRGIKWPLLTPDQIATVPPLRELARMRGVA